MEKGTSNGLENDRKRLECGPYFANTDDILRHYASLHPMAGHAASIVSPKIFRALGFTLPETAVAIALLHRGSGRASEIAQDVRIPRQTTYSILAKLVHDGLVTPTSGKGVRRFTLDYGQLMHYIEERKDELERIRESLRNGYAPSVAIQESQSRLPRVAYYEGATGLGHLFESMLEVYRKGKSKKFRGYGINFLASTRGLEDYVRSFLEERGRLGVSADLFIARGPDDFKITNESSRLGRNIKHLDIDEQNAGIYLVGNRVYLFSFKENVGVVVENQAIAEFLKNAFDDHWAKSA